MPKQLTRRLWHSRNRASGKPGAVQAALRQWLAAVSLTFRERGDLTSARLDRLTRSVAVVRRYTGPDVVGAPRDYARREVVRLERERGRELQRLFWCRVDVILEAGGVIDPEAVIVGEDTPVSKQSARIARLESRIAVAGAGRPPAMVTPAGWSGDLAGGGS